MKGPLSRIRMTYVWNDDVVIHVDKITEDEKLKDPGYKDWVLRDLKIQMAKEIVKHLEPHVEIEEFEWEDER